MSKIIKHKDIFLTLMNYKEPLREIPSGKGYGYYGTISITLDGTKIQCHICGELFSEVGSHARQAHKISSTDYKDRFGLSINTALISEQIRQERKLRTLKWLKEMSKEERAKYQKLAKERMREVGRSKRSYKESLENKNKKGTCPDQLLHKIKEVATKLGHTPSLAEFIDATDGQRYKHLIIKTFGSWLNALKVAKLSPKEKVQRGGGGNQYKLKYSNEELLEYLFLYAQENQKLPTATDSKRGLIPDYAIYQQRFGSFEEARQLAGVYKVLK